MFSSKNGHENVLPILASCGHLLTRSSMALSRTPSYAVPFPSPSFPSSPFIRLSGRAIRSHGSIKKEEEEEEEGKKSDPGQKRSYVVRTFLTPSQPMTSFLPMVIASLPSQPATLRIHKEAFEIQYFPRTLFPRQSSSIMESASRCLCTSLPPSPHPLWQQRQSSQTQHLPSEFGSVSLLSSTVGIN